MPAIGAREVDRVPIGHRVYALEDDGNIRRIGGRAFAHLYDGASDKPIPEYADRFRWTPTSQEKARIEDLAL